MRGKWSALTVWDGPQSLGAVLRLRGKGRLSVVRPNGADGKPKEGSKQNCLRIESKKITVAHPGDIVATDWDGNIFAVHGLEWATSHGASFTREDT